MSDFIIKATGLAKTIDGEPVLEGVSLQIKKGSIYGLIGPNGAGKTTTLKILLGLIRATAGEVQVLGTDVNTFPNQVMQNIGYVPEHPQIYPWFKVKEIIKFGERIYPNWDREKVDELCQKFNLPLEKRVRNLSKGMKTQLSLVMALAFNPKLLILDEPTSGLDPAVRKEFLESVLIEAAEKETTVVISTHNMHELERVADQIGFLYQGRLILDKPLEVLRKEAKRLQVTLERPLAENLTLIPEVIDVGIHGNSYTITVLGHKDRVVGEMKKYGPLHIEEANMNLEEIFISLTKKEAAKC